MFRASTIANGRSLQAREQLFCYCPAAGVVALHDAKGRVVNNMFSGDGVDVLAAATAGHLVVAQGLLLNGDAAALLAATDAAGRTPRDRLAPAPPDGPGRDDARLLDALLAPARGS